MQEGVEREKSDRDRQRRRSKLADLPICILCQGSPVRSTPVHYELGVNFEHS